MSLLPMRVLALLPFMGLADLPVHCLRHQILGDWEFVISPAKPERSSCGHQRPDNPDKQPALSLLASMGGATRLRLAVQDPDTVSTSEGETGTWTMIYDEGFEVALGGKVFFAFSKFEMVPDGHGGQTNQSHCDQTFVGWYRDSSRSQWGCYYGAKVGVAEPAAITAATGADHGAARRPERAAVLARDKGSVFDYATATAEEPAAPISAEQPSTSQAAAQSLLEDAFAEPSSSAPVVPKSAGYDKPMPHHFQAAVAEALNFLQLGWRAAPYSMFTGKTPRELNRFAGTRRSRPRPNRRTSPVAEMEALMEAAMEPPSFFSMRSKRRKAHNRAEAPLDWRKVNGKNWLQPVVSQGDCGSCYAISTVHMLTARNRIKHGDPNEPAFSVVFPLRCSEYNQGCNGGYGFLESKWAEDVGLVPESCAPFTDDTDGACQALQDCDMGDTRYRAVNHRYVGGFYGGSDHAHIKRELVSNGPLVLSFEPKEDFMYYKSGLYRSGQNKIHQEWEQVDHAVLLIGLGQESGVSYWVLQNSWGVEWGEQGYFRMARGIDESGCESIAVAADVVEDSSNAVLDNFLASL